MASDILDDSSSKNQLLAEAEDPCNSYEWSIIFIILLIFAICILATEIHAIFKRRGENLSGLDIANIILFVCAAIKFGPMLTQILHAGHKVMNYTQSGCKMMFYTDFGLRNVVMLVVTAQIVYAYLVTKKGFNQDRVDEKIRQNVPWIIMLVFAVEAVFGMAAAVYVDVIPNDWRHCVWTPTMKLTPALIIPLELLVRTVIPYILPVLLFPWVLITFHKTLPDIDAPKLKSQVQCVLCVAWAYIVLNLPYSIVVVIDYSLLWTANFASHNKICHAQWFFFLVHMLWYIWVPLVYLKYETDLGNTTAVTKFVYGIWDGARSKIVSASDDRQVLQEST